MKSDEKMGSSAENMIVRRESREKVKVSWALTLSLLGNGYCPF